MLPNSAKALPSARSSAGLALILLFLAMLALPIYSQSNGEEDAADDEGCQRGTRRPRRLKTPRPWTRQKTKP